MMSPSSFSADEVTQFRRDGYIIVRGLATPTLCDQLMGLARQHLAARIGPLEHEAEALKAYYALLALVKDKDVRLEEYARDMIVQEELHLDEVNKMLRRPGEIQPFAE